MASEPPARPVSSPEFRELEMHEIEEILERNHVGRIAYTFRDRVDIVPLHYVYDNGWLYGRTSPSDKLVTLRHHQWIAFEVDEPDGVFDWKSVVLYSSFFPVPPDTKEWRHAVEVLRRLVPEAFRPNDPVPDRTIVFRIPVQDASGRAARSR